MKLIVENDFNSFDVITESKNSNTKYMKIRGPYVITEKKNANGRVYSRSLMEKVVEEFDKEWIKTGRAFGELNHSPSTTIDYDRACHRITNLEQDGDMWIGESLVLCSKDPSCASTPKGIILASVLDCGGKPGMSTRGVGEISEGNKVDKVYKMISCDVVTEPSGPGCYVNGIYEAKNFMINEHGDIIEKQYEIFENGLANIPTGSTKTEAGNKHIIQIIENFLKGI